MLLISLYEKKRLPQLLETVTLGDIKTVSTSSSFTDFFPRSHGHEEITTKMVSLESHIRKRYGMKK